MQFIDHPLCEPTFWPFPSSDCMNRTQKYAMIIFTKALRLWKYCAMRFLDKKIDSEKVIKLLYLTSYNEVWAEFHSYQEIKRIVSEFTVTYIQQKLRGHLPSVEGILFSAYIYHRFLVRL